MQSVSKLSNYGERSAPWENARASERRSPVSLTRVSFRVRVSRDFSRLPQTESLLAGYLLHEKLFSP